MKKKTVLGAIVCAALGLMALPAYADLPGLSNGVSAESILAPAPDSTNTSTTEVSTPPPAQNQPAAKNQKKAASGGANTTHTLEQVMFKLSRAQKNLEDMGTDYGGRGTKAIQYIKLALDELQAAKQQQ